MHGLDGDLTLLGQPLLAGVWIASFPADENLERLEGRRGIVGRDGLGEVQVVNGVSIAVQIVAETRLPRLPDISTDISRNVIPLPWLRELPRS